MALSSNYVQRTYLHVKQPVLTLGPAFRDLLFDPEDNEPGISPSTTQPIQRMYKTHMARQLILRYGKNLVASKAWGGRGCLCHKK